ncbi:LysR family transcriptional regulator [Cupriavidus necator]
MDLRQLRQFVVVAEELNFRRAAERLHMTQPPLSASIQRLESSLGVSLIERSRTMVRLTPAGTAFLHEVRHLLGQAQCAVEAAKSAVDGSADVLRIASVESAALELLPSVLQRLRVQFPNARLLVQTDSTQNEILALQAGALDVAIIVPSAHESAQLVIADLKQERFCVAVCKTHPLSARKRVRLSELAEDQFLSLYPFTSSPGYSAAVLRAFQESKVYPRVLPGDSKTFLANLALVGAGGCVALVPRPMRRLRVANVVFIDVACEAGKPLMYPLALARTAKNDRTLVRAFWQAAMSISGSSGSVCQE